MDNLWFIVEKHKIMKVIIHDYAGHSFTHEFAEFINNNKIEITYVYCSGLLTPQFSQTTTNSSLKIKNIAINKNYKKNKYNFIKRSIYELIYALKLVKYVLTIKDCVIYSANSPSHVQLILLLVCQYKNIKFYNWIQDVYCVGIKENFNKNTNLHKLIRYVAVQIDKYVIINSKCNILICDEFVDIIKKYIVQSFCYKIIYNWGTVGSINDEGKNNDWIKNYKLYNKFIITYSGTLALKHNPSIIENLVKEYSTIENIQFIIISEGPGREYLEEKLSPESYKNVLFFNYLDQINYRLALSSSDMFLVLLDKNAGAFSVPSKILSYICVGRPIVGIMPENNLSYKIVNKNYLGKIVDINNLSYIKLRNVINDIYSNKNNLFKYKKACEIYKHNNFNYNLLLKKFFSNDEKRS